MSDGAAPILDVLLKNKDAASQYLALLVIAYLFLDMILKRAIGSPELRTMSKQYDRLTELFTRLVDKIPDYNAAMRDHNAIMREYNAIIQRLGVSR